MCCRYLHFSVPYEQCTLVNSVVEVNEFHFELKFFWDRTSSYEGIGNCCAASIFYDQTWMASYDSKSHPGGSELLPNLPRKYDSLWYVFSFPWVKADTSIVKVSTYLRKRRKLSRWGHFKNRLLNYTCRSMCPSSLNNSNQTISLFFTFTKSVSWNQPEGRWFVTWNKSCGLVLTLGPSYKVTTSLLTTSKEPG